MSIMCDPAIVRTRCHVPSKRKGKLGPEDETPDTHIPSWSLYRLRSVAVPSLSSLLSSITWTGNRSWYMGSHSSQRVSHADNETRRQILYLRMRNAVSYSEWRSCAYELDKLEDNNTWKETFESSEYNPTLVKERLKQLEEARISCDTNRMLYLIRTSLSRDLGDMSNAALYKHSHFGTKGLIDQYITTAVDTISTLVDLAGKRQLDVEETRQIFEQLLETRQAYGRSALLLSGGATFGMCHIGVIKSLWEAKLLPRIISGASAGSIVSAMCCCHTEDEFPAVLQGFSTMDMHVFNEPNKEENILQKVERLLKFGSLMDIHHLTRTIRGWLGDKTFQEAYNKTRRILNICVSCAGVYELPRLLNFITAPNVLIWSAVTVSCSVPYVFSPPVLMAKDPITGAPVPWNGLHKHYIDGSVDGDLPMNRLSEMFNVNHFIVSQVNPHVAPFLPRDDGLGDGTTSAGTYPFWLRCLSPVTDLAVDEILHRLSWAVDFGFLPNFITKVASVMNQKYSGDINIYPNLSYTDLPFILQNPTTEFIQRAAASGERATWPKLGRIRNHCAIEVALDTAIRQTRAMVLSKTNHQKESWAVGGSHRPLGPTNDSDFYFQRRNSYSQSHEQNKHVEKDTCSSGGRPILRRACSSVPSDQSHTPGVIDGVLSSSKPEKERLAQDAYPKRPTLIKRQASWGPSSYDYGDFKLTLYDSSSPCHSRRSSLGTGDWQTPVATETPFSKHAHQVKANSSAQCHLHMTSKTPAGLPDMSTRNKHALQACSSG
ncbi:hypothetical protein FE257_008369 [Aspergillus nanangensis]|uniref:Patatin-like phospholipase domain-containing protein n=1 Tax=Aspergillus nanangensis TaxID=2582783 RepID=A0AAD4GUU2_ASPNN|nr:hypothetical protein FE257_008369 [Aspergillus nanangensis]